MMSHMHGLFLVRKGSGREASVPLMALYSREVKSIPIGQTVGL